MANKRKLTVFQRMNNMFGPDGINVPRDQTNRYSIGSGELLKTDNKADYEAAKLQAQQSKYISGQWKKVDNELFQQSIHYETTRVGSYSDFENMEFYPEIAAALDIMMEEATTVNDKGEVINIYSDSKRVKKILKDLFHNRLDIHTSLPMWTRNTCKYGDNFVFLNIDDKAGVIGAKQMHNFEMERREGSIYDAISRQHSTGDNRDDSKVKFYWKGRDVEFSSWQMAHFRLLGDDRRLPYGTCLKYNSRVETSEGYKEIKDIVIGDMVYSFDEMNQVKVLSKVLDTVNSGNKKTYKLSTKHNFIDASKEHKIMYYNTELNKFDYKNTLDFKLGDLLVVDKSNLNNVNVPIIKNKPESNKNGFWNNVGLIPDFVDTKFAEFFGYLIGDGWIHNDSVFIALSEHKSINKKYIQYMNQITGRDIKFSGGDNGMAQGICNSKTLSIILRDMGFLGDVYSKRIPKWVYTSSMEVRQAFLNGIIDADGSLFIDKWDCLRYSIELSNEELINDIKILVQSLGLKSGKICSRLRKGSGIGDREFKTQQESFYFYFYDSSVRQKNKYDLIGDRLTNDFILEPIKSIEESGEHETYDIYVENDNHNFYANGIVVHNSVLEKARRIWKQLILSEDSMLVYRVTRAPERRVYKIYVGNIDDGDVEAYVNAIADRFKRMPIIDPQTGQMDLRFNQLSNDQDYFIPVRTEDAPNPIDTLPGACIALDTRIPLLDGRTLELNEIISEWDNGNRDLWVYSCDPNTGSLAPGLITWAGETRKNTEVLKITLDNGEEIISTPDHKFVHRTNGFVEAKDLVIGDSLMPFYTDTKKIKTNTNGDYHRVWDSSKEEWVFTHRLVVDGLDSHGLIKEFLFDEKYLNTDKKIRHHKNHDRFNNNPENLVWMNGGDHMRYHQSVIKETIWANPEENKAKIKIGIDKYISNLTVVEKEIRSETSKNNSITTRKKSTETFNNNPNKEKIIRNRGIALSKVKSTPEFKEKFSLIAKEQWLNEDYKNKVFSKKQTITFTNELYNMFFEMFKVYGKADLTLNELNNSSEFLNEFKTSNYEIRSSITNLSEFTANHLSKMLKINGFKNYRDWCKQTAKELGYKNVRAWRYFIEKENKKELYNHKIVNIEWLSERKNTGTITVDGDEIYHNYHTFAIESGVFIKNSNLDQIADIEYLRSNLFTALRVPKPFLGFDDAAGEGKNLALQDIRFSRTVNRIQQAMLQELNKIAIIHLYLLGFEEDFDNFTLTLNNPSTQAEMLKIEHLQAKVTLYKDAVSDAGNGFGAYSMTRGKRDILGMSDDDIKSDLLEQRMEKAAAAELANSANVIKHTGMFDIVDRVYGDFKVALEGGAIAGGEGGEEGADGGGGGGGGGGGLGGSFGGGGVGGEDLDFGDEGDEEGEEGGELGGEVGGEVGAEDELADAEPEEVSERIKKVNKILTERKELLTKKLNTRTKKYKDRFVEALIESIKPEPSKMVDKVKIYDKNIKVNKEIDDMINNIDKMLDE